MSTEYVCEIRLRNSTGTVQCDIPVNMDIDLPDILYVNPLLAPYPKFGGYFKLNSRHCSPAPATIHATHQTTAIYHAYLLGPNDLATCLNYLMYNPTPIVGGWHPFATAISTGISLQYLGAEPPISLPLASREPECYCDMRTLMSQEHPAGCPWLIWKRGNHQ